jgi:hypothetical protein
MDHERKQLHAIFRKHEPQQSPSHRPPLPTPLPKKPPPLPKKPPPLPTELKRRLPPSPPKKKPLASPTTSQYGLPAFSYSS